MAGHGAWLAVLFAKCLCLDEDGPGRGHLCHSDKFLVFFFFFFFRFLQVFFFGFYTYTIFTLSIGTEWPEQIV